MRVLVLLLALVAALHGPAFAQTQAAAPANRVALVIGNAAYPGADALKTPANDAQLIADALRKVGFAVSQHRDLAFAQMSVALRAFSERARTAHWAVIYFAGHGVGMRGDTFVLPVDARLDKDSSFAAETLGLEQFAAATVGATKLRLIIIDAARNSSFADRMAGLQSTRSVSRGLPPVELDGVVVAYAARHGTVVAESDGDTSIYARTLAEQMQVANVDVRVMFGRVRNEVRAATNGLQEPYFYGSFDGDLYYFATAGR